MHVRDFWKKVLPLTLALGFGVAGCGGAMKEVKAKAATELGCAQDQVDVKEAGTNTYTAMGCGSTANCTKSGDAITCAKQQPPEAGAPAGAPPAQ